jgi:hypothetical protein
MYTCKPFFFILSDHSVVRIREGSWKGTANTYLPAVHHIIGTAHVSSPAGQALHFCNNIILPKLRYAH